MTVSGTDKRGLGRGLSALMAKSDLVEGIGSDQTLAREKKPDTQAPIENLHPNPEQPRRTFAKEDMDELTASVQEKGVLQPLIVRAHPELPGHFQIVAGERRWRAAQAAGLHELPILIKELDDLEVLEVAIIENIQRSNLNAVEEAQGFRHLMDRFGHTQERMAEALGKSRSHIANLLRLLSLPEDVLILLQNNELSAGHARALITAEDPSGLAKKVVAKGLSVRQVEKLAKTKATEPKKARESSAVKDADTKALEQDLAAGLGMSVSIDHKPGTESGQISVSYNSFDALDQICQALSAIDLDASK